MTTAAGSTLQVAWRCLLNGDHVRETRVATRTYQQAIGPYHMGNKVHPSESFAAYVSWLVKEWHPTKDDLRPDQVTRASGREIHWICDFGPEWPAPIYSRTLSETGASGVLPTRPCGEGESREPAPAQGDGRSC